MKLACRFKYPFSFRSSCLSRSCFPSNTMNRASIGLTAGIRRVNNPANNALADSSSRKKPIPSRRIRSGEESLLPEVSHLVALLHVFLNLAVVCCSPNLGDKIDRKSTRLNSSHLVISYDVFCLKKNHPRGPQRPVHLVGAQLLIGPAPDGSQ